MSRSARPPLLFALACLAALAGLAALALGVRTVRVRDEAVLHGFMALDRPAIDALFKALVHLVDPLPYACLGLACVVVALYRRRGRRALAVAVLLAATGATTQILKHALAQPRVVGWLARQIGSDAFPSGHSTAAMTLALCAILVSPPAWRAVVVLAGGAFAVGVGYGVVVLAWHFPSDVLGGFLVAGLWTGIAVAALRRFERGEPERAARRGWPLAAGLAACAAIGAMAAIGSRSDAVARYAMERQSLVAAALVIAALGLGLVTAAGVAAGRTTR